MKRYKVNAVTGDAIAQAVCPRLSTVQPGFDSEGSHVEFVVDRAVLKQLSFQYFGFPCHSSSPLIAPQPSPCIIQGWYNMPIK
jgi:hypothetical protein